MKDDTLRLAGLSCYAPSDQAGTATNNEASFEYRELDGPHWLSPSNHEKRDDAYLACLSTVYLFELDVAPEYLDFFTFQRLSLGHSFASLCTTEQVHNRIPSSLSPCSKRLRLLPVSLNCVDAFNPGVEQCHPIFPRIDFCARLQNTRASIFRSPSHNKLHTPSSSHGTPEESSPRFP